MQIENTDKSQTKERFSNDTLSSLLSKLQNAYKLVHMKFSEEKETLEARNRYIGDHHDEAARSKTNY